MVPGLSILIKPASGNCNLRCKYCFYADVAENREVQNYGMMAESTLENIVKKGLAEVDQFITFAFQGGEPTLRGLDFFRAVNTYVEKHNVNNVKVNFAIQTNGMLINDEWAKLFKEYNYLVGLSLDGPKEVNDKNRVNATGGGSYKKIMNTARLFDKYGVEYNILTVVNKYVVKHTAKIYNFFRNQKFNYLQFIPCMDELGEEAGHNPYSLTADEYGDFLVQLFDLWYADFKKGNRVSIRLFDNILSIMLGQQAESCDMQPYCSVNPTIEADGSVYPCDFYVLDEWKLGNINDDPIMDILQNDIGKTFIQTSIELSTPCRGCQFYPVCRGGCRRYCEPIQTGSKEVQNIFCKAYKKFYGHSLSGFQDIAYVLRNQFMNAQK